MSHLLARAGAYQSMDVAPAAANGPTPSERDGSFTCPLQTARAGRIELSIARVLCRASYRVLSRVCVVQPSGGHPSEGYCAKSSLSTDAKQLR